MSGVDHIDLSGIDVNAKLSGDQAFVWGGSGMGRLTFANGVLSADVTGDSKANFAIALGAVGFSANDLVL